LHLIDTQGLGVPDENIFIIAFLK